jgi:hypothetical protein
MNKNVKGLIAVLIVGAIVFVVYKKFGNTKKNDASYIVSSGKHGNVEALMTFDKDYIKAWANAIRNKQETFTLKGVKYNTQGGKIVK